jgi:hypothetical protein
MLGFMKTLSGDCIRRLTTIGSGGGGARMEESCEKEEKEEEEEKKEEEEDTRSSSENETIRSFDAYLDQFFVTLFDLHKVALDRIYNRGKPGELYTFLRDKSEQSTQVDRESLYALAQFEVEQFYEKYRGSSRK